MASLDSIGGIHYEIMKRCYNDKSVMWKTYGAKGIKVCNEWHDRENFKTWAIKNGYEKGMRLLRKDSKKDYEPDNCYIAENRTNPNRETNKERIKRVNEQIKFKQECGTIYPRRYEELNNIYVSMRSRCYNKNHVNYHNYGGRGITICDEWIGVHGYDLFVKWAFEQGKYVREKGLTIDRIDVNKGYSPENCKFSTRKEQSLNRRCNIIVEYYGRKYVLSQIAEMEEVKYGLLYSRYCIKKMSIYDSISDIKNKYS